MTHENKDLILKDLCGRLPYGVICKDDYAKIEGRLCQIGINYDMCLLSDDYGKTEWAYIPNCRPYLFPLSSMTEEQRLEYNSIIYHSVELHCERYYDVIDVDYYEELHDFYHKNHFDYRGLIRMGLAIDATGLNIY